VAATFVEHAPAKVNLTLRVLGRRPDGYHNLASLVVFADVGDRLSFEPGPRLRLTLCGPTAAAAGRRADNLVLAAARALAARVRGLTLGRFRLDKRLPVAAGLGGGSADAAAALRLLARANGLRADDRRVLAAARATGADVPVCVACHARWMRGAGERLGAAMRLPRLHAVLVHPGVPLATREVFRQFDQSTERRRRGRLAGQHRVPHRAAALVAMLVRECNDLEPAALALAPVIADVLGELRELPGCRLARMSGSGTACFGLFVSARAAETAARTLRRRRRRWWVTACALGGA
jgi:4-diphosphocytidyl-2-C-methyl-D-erythritol kinase